MIRFRTVAAVCAALVLVAACGGPKYMSDYAPNADFSKYQTFAWSPHGNNLPDNPRYNTSLIDGRLKPFILEKFPESAAAADIRDHGPDGTKKGSKSAYDCTQDDDVLKGRITRTEKVKKAKDSDS